MHYKMMPERVVYAAASTFQRFGKIEYKEKASTSWEITKEEIDGQRT